MHTNRRSFIKYAGMASVAGIISPRISMGNEKAETPKHQQHSVGSNKLKFYFEPYTLKLTHAFNLASFSRTTTPIMLTRIVYDGITGYGEASMPPYLGESHATATKFLSQVNLEQFNDPFRMDDILSYVDHIAPGNMAAKASIDIALHDLVGKLLGQPWYRIFGFSPEKAPNISFTIGIDTPEVVRKKVLEAAPYKILKVKLGLGNDKEMIETIRSVTDKPITVDVNQGWKNKEKALEMIQWLSERNVLFVEQPMPKTAMDDMAWLTAHSPLPTMADEAVQRLSDVKKLNGVYSGINVKLMKCGGIREGHQMLILARALGMKTMIGCMTETSCAVSAADQLSPLVDWADLDGNLLVSNDPYHGVEIHNGKIILAHVPGIGLTKTR